MTRYQILMTAGAGEQRMISGSYRVDGDIVTVWHNAGGRTRSTRLGGSADYQDVLARLMLLQLDDEESRAIPECTAHASDGRLRVARPSHCDKPSVPELESCGEQILWEHPAHL